MKAITLYAITLSFLVVSFIPIYAEWDITRKWDYYNEPTLFLTDLNYQTDCATWQFRQATHGKEYSHVVMGLVLVYNTSESMDYDIVAQLKGEINKSTTFEICSSQYFNSTYTEIN